MQSETPDHQQNLRLIAFALRRAGRPHEEVIMLLEAADYLEFMETSLYDELEECFTLLQKTRAGPA